MFLTWCCKWAQMVHLVKSCKYHLKIGSILIFDKIMDLLLPIFTLKTYRFCMKCIEFTTRTYNFKNLALGSLIWSAKTGVNSSYFPQKFLKGLKEGLLGASVNKNKYILLVDLVAHFLKLCVGCMREYCGAIKIGAPEIGF